MRRVATVLAALVCMLPSIACADTTIGISGLVLSGTHQIPQSTTHGTGGGALLTLDERMRGFDIHIEGLPSVATATEQTRLGSITASLGYFAATARLRLDPEGRVWIGAGTQVITQRTPIESSFGFETVDASRLAGTRFEAIGRLPVGTSRFVQVECAATPSLSGNISQALNFPNGFTFAIARTETASMVDASAAYGIARGRMEYLFGIRTINFAARFPDGSEADRNSGVGLTAEIRARL